MNRGFKEISAPQIGACTPQSHDFKRIDEFTGGIKYRCKKCGLESVATNLTGNFDKAFYGSIIDGYTFLWRPDYMDPREIVQIKVSYGDCPIRNVIINGQKLTYKNSINGSRDGWMTFPEGFFDSHTLTLSTEQKSEISELLCQLNLSSWETDLRVFDNFDAPGFCLYDTFTCKFSNGYRFICYNAGDYRDFHRLTALLDRLTGL